VPTVLHVIDDLTYRGVARQLMLLAGGLVRAGWNVRVCVLGAETPWSEELRKAGVGVETLGRTRMLDLWPFLALRGVVKGATADVVHAWGPLALRALTTLARPTPAPLVSGILPPVGAPGWLDRRLLRRTRGVLAFGAAEADRYVRFGWPADRLTTVQPAVLPPTGSAAVWTATPAQGRVLLGVGPLERHKGFHDAVWALDILHYLDDQLFLVLAGVGSDRPRTEAFAKQIGVAWRVSFLGACPDLAPLYERAEIVWVPGRGGGVNAALEAMAAGRAVVAARTPAVLDLIRDGESGVLFSPGDKPDLARQTRFLLEDPERRRRVAEAGRLRAEREFTVEQLVSGCLRLYGAV
jgi:glycosyltransferase involved in cell wall biosynthesis